MSRVGSRCLSSSGSWKRNCCSWIAAGSGMTLCGVLTARVAGRLTVGPMDTKSIKNQCLRYWVVLYTIWSTTFLYHNPHCSGGGAIVLLSMALRQLNLFILIPSIFNKCIENKRARCWLMVYSPQAQYIFAS